MRARRQACRNTRPRCLSNSAPNAWPSPSRLRLHKASSVPTAGARFRCPQQAPQPRSLRTAPRWFSRTSTVSLRGSTRSQSDRRSRGLLRGAVIDRRSKTAANCHDVAATARVASAEDPGRAQGTGEHDRRFVRKPAATGRTSCRRTFEVSHHRRGVGCSYDLPYHASQWDSPVGRTRSACVAS